MMIIQCCKTGIVNRQKMTQGFILNNYCCVTFGNSLEYSNFRLFVTSCIIFSEKRCDKIRSKTHSVLKSITPICITVHNTVYFSDLIYSEGFNYKKDT